MTADQFLDASYAIAMVNRLDVYHTRALAHAARIRAERQRIIVTQAVLLEIGNSLARFRFRTEAVRLLESLENEPLVTVVPLNEALYAEAFDLFRGRPDKEWGLVDCLSFVVMAKRGITEALTADEHFEQAGFRALLRHEP